jgi:hypothetical protein
LKRKKVKIEIPAIKMLMNDLPPLSQNPFLALGMVPVIERLPFKRNAPNSNPSTAKKEKLFFLLCFFFNFLFVYDSYTGGFHCNISIYIKYPYLVHPLHYFPSSPTPLLEMTERFNVPYSHIYRKYLNHFHTSFPLEPFFTLPWP